MSPPTSDGTGVAEHAEDFSFQLLLRTRLDRETDLLIQRTAWVVGSQAFLFSAYAVALGGVTRGGAPSAITAKEHLLVNLIPWVAVVSLLVLLMTIGAGIAALTLLRRHTRNHDPRSEILEPGPAVRAAGLAGPLLVPTAFLATWLILLLHR